MLSTPNNALTTKARIIRLTRFAMGGIINTLVTYSLYLLFNELISYQWAYLFAYVIGIIFAYWFNAIIVFKVALSWASFFSYPIIYVIQYALSALLLAALVEWFAISQNIAPLLVVVVLFPITFILNKLLLTRKKHSNTHHSSI